MSVAVIERYLVILKKPEFAPVFYIDASPDRSQEDVVNAGLAWLQRQTEGRRGVLASDQASGLRDLPRIGWVRSLERLHTRDTGVAPHCDQRPLLAFFPWKDLLLKLTDRYLDRVSSMCVLTWGRRTSFLNYGLSMWVPST